MIYSPKCSIILLEGSDIVVKNYLLIYSEFEISFKEGTETEGWLNLLFETNAINEEIFRRHRYLCGRIRRMLISSCKKLKENK